jgi:hypothetical protein
VGVHVLLLSVLAVAGRVVGVTATVCYGCIVHLVIFKFFVRFCS